MEILNKILEAMNSAEGYAVTVAVFVEMGLRLIKSEKPKSILYIITDVLTKSGEILKKAGGFLDKILPQRLK